MHQVVYASAAVEAFSEAELSELLSRARMKNERLGVTGMLLYHEGSFLQVVEGREEVLEALFRTISKDQRHHRIVSLLRRPVQERQFGNWKMGFASAKNLPNHLPGFSDYLRLRGDPTEAGNAAARLLAAFREGRFHSYVAS
jgi:FAD-dependent sensor of blue light